jgi:ATP-dependent Zn protease
MRKNPKWGWIALAAVLVLAFVASQVINPSESGESPTFSQFLDDLEAGEVESVVIDSEDGTLEVVPAPAAQLDAEYETDYAYGYEETLIRQLRDDDVPFEVDSGGGGSVLGWLFYLLPAILFLLFWRWLARRLDELRPNAS